MPTRALPTLLLALVLANVAPGCRSGAVPPSAEPPQPTLELPPGVTYRTVWQAEGPWAIHWVEVALDACGVEISTAKGEDRIAGLERTSDLAARASPDLGPVLAALNADFFRADPPGVPEGPQVSRGTVVAGPASFGPPVAERFDVPQPVFGVTRQGGRFIGEGAFEGAAWSSTREPWPLGRVNAPPGLDSVAMFNRYAGPGIALGEGLHAVALLAETSAPAADTTVAVVVMTDAAATEVRIPSEGFAVAGRGSAAQWVGELVAGDTVRWTFEVHGGPGDVRELVGGFPLLLLGGEPVLDRVPRINPSFAFGRHPRSAVGIRADGTLILVAVDGRQPGYSEGMTLPELTDLLLDLGTIDALNLDGGGSTALVVAGDLVNRPSDADGERAVSNAVLVTGPPSGECPGR